MLLTPVPADQAAFDVPAVLVAGDDEPADAPAFQPRRPGLAAGPFPAPPKIAIAAPAGWGTAEAQLAYAASLAALGCYEEARRQLEAARLRFPDAGEVLRQQALLAERMGAHDQAQRHWQAFLGRFATLVTVADRAAFLRALAYTRSGVYLILDAADRAPVDDPAFRDAILAVARHRRWPALAAMLGAPAEVTEAAETARQHALPDGWDAVAAEAGAAIRESRTEDAQALIRCLPPEFLGHRIVSELFAWAEVQAGRLAEANRILGGWHDRHYWPGLDAPLQSLMRLDARRIAQGSGSLCVMAILRAGEEAELPDFLAHHRAIGAERFVLVDTGIAAEARELILAQEDCHVFWTQDDRVASADGMRWINHILRRHVIDGWVAVIPAGQRLALPHGIAASGPDLTRHLQKQGFEGVVATGPDATARIAADPAPPSYWMMRHPSFPTDRPPQGPVVMAKVRTVRFLSPGVVLPLRLADFAVELRAPATR